MAGCGAETFPASQIYCTPLDSQMRAAKHQTGASRVFSKGSWSAGLSPATASATYRQSQAVELTLRKCSSTLGQH